MAVPKNPWLAPVVIDGTEPYPPGTTEEEKQQMRDIQKWSKIGSGITESCPAKVVLAGGMGLGLGAVFSLMGATFALDDPLSRYNSQLEMGARAKTMAVARDMGRNMWSQGKGFAKVGMLFVSFECVLEGYRAKHDIWNGIWGGFFSGAVLARNSGPVGMFTGAVGFAAFSAAIEMYMHKEPSEED